MKIILFADRLPPLIGGMETHAHYFNQYFKSRYELSIISRLDGKDILVDNDYNYIRHVSLDEFLIQFKNEKTVLFFNSGRWIEELKHIREVLPSAIMTYRTGGNEIIQSPLTMDMKDYEDRKSFWRDAINSTIDFLITNSDFTDKRLLDFGIKKELLCHIAGGIDDDTIHSAISRRNGTRLKYGVLENEHLCVCCARFVQYKRADFLIKALNYCKEKITLFLAGDGPLENEMKSLAKNQKYNIRFLGKLSQEEAVNLIASADVYVQASTDLIKEVPGGSYIHTEGMGRSLLEAICTGTPVVVTDCGAVSEYIDSENGILVHTETEMASAIDSILNMKSRIKNAEKYIGLYSFNKIFEEYINLWN